MKKEEDKKQHEELQALKKELQNLKQGHKINQAHYKNAQRIAKFGFWHLDIKANNLIWSDEIYRLFNLKPQEFKATYEAFLDTIHPDDREMVNEAYTKSLKTKKPYQIIHRLKLKNGKIKYVQERCETIFDKDGNPISSTGTVQDITLRIQSERRLKQQNKEYAALNEEYLSQNDELLEKNKEYATLNEEYLAINDEIKSQNDELKKSKKEIEKSEEKFSKAFHLNSSIIGLNLLETGKYVEINQSFLDKLEYKRNEVIGKDATEIQIIEKQYRDILREKLVKQGFVRNEKANLQTKSGKTITVLLTAEIIEINNVKYIFTVGLDITDLEKTEQKLKQQNKEYAALNEEYLSQNDELLEKNQELQEVIEANHKANEKIHISNIKLKQQNEEYFALNEEYLAINDEIKSQNKELRIAKEKITETNNLLTEAQKIANKGHWSWDFIKEELTWSDEIFNIFGYTRENFEVSAANFEKIIHPDDLEKFLQKRETILTNDKKIDIICRIIRPDGKIRHIQEKAKIIRNKNNKPIKIFGTLQDITQRIEFEKTLAESEERFRSFMETATDMMNICDANLNLIYVNNSMCKTLGYKQKELLGKHVSIIFKPQEKEKRFKSKLSNTLKEHGKINYQTIWLTKSGKEVIGELKVVAKYDENKNYIGSRAVFHNITKSIKALKQLSESENRYKSLYNNATIGLYRTTTEGKIVMANPALVKMLKYNSFKDLSKRNVETDGFLQKKDRIEFKKEIEKKGKIIDKEFIWKAKNGSKIYIRESAKAIKDNKGKTLFYEGTVEDITLRRKAEILLKESEEKYRALVENSYDGIYIYRNNNFLFVNKTIINILGYTEEELHKMSIWEIIHPNDRKRIIEISKKRAEGKEVPNSYSAKIVCKNGEIKDAEFSVRIIKYQGNYAVLGTVRDISERKKAEKELQQSNDTLNTIFENSPYIQMIVNTQGQVENINKAGTKFTNRKKDDILGLLGGDAISCSHAYTNVGCGQNNVCKDCLIRTKVMKTFKTGKPILDKEGKYIIIRNKKECISHLLVSTIPITIKKNKKVLVSLIDISERKQAEEALKESEIKYREMAELLPQTVYESDLKGNATLINNKGYAMFGYTKEEFANKTINVFDYIAPEDHERLANNLKHRLSIKGDDAQEYTGIKKDGTKFPIMVYSNIIFKESKPVGLRGIIIDLTKQKQQEEKNNEINRKLNTLIGNLDGMVYQCLNDKYWTMLFISNGCEKLTNYKTEELINNNKIAYEDIIVEDDKKKVRNKISEALKNKTAFNITYNIKTKDGVIKTVWEKGLGIYNNKGNLTHIEGYIVDITKQIIYEEKLKQQNIELNIAKEKAEESDKLKSAFLANMSHEIRTPMNGVVGFAELLGEDDLEPEEREEYVKIIQRSSHQLLGIINDIIDISKIETGIIDIFEEKVNINDVLTEQLEFFTATATEKDIELKLKQSLTDKQSQIYTDEIKLKQIITNLIGNSVKFTDKGQIEFGYELKEEFLEFYVRDTGIGIDKKQQELIFQPFRQIEETTTRKYGGTGLGLHITKAYIENMGGRVFVDSILGQGSTFFFTIPYKPVEEKYNKLIKNDSFGSKIKWNNKTILIAEDEQMNYLFLERVLSNSKIKVLHAQNGQEAVKLCKENKNINLILMDIKMPKMNGYEAVREIRKFNKEIPIIAQTAFALSDDKLKAMKAGCNDYISKPINRKLLLEKINNFIK